MAIVLLCSSCEHKLKVRDELAGRKVKCPECGKVNAVPERDEAIRPKPPVAMNGDRDRQPKRRRPLDTDGDEDCKTVQEKKGILSTDMKQLRHAFNSFDIKRFTVVGWLLFVIAFAGGIGIAFLVGINEERIFGPSRPNEPYRGIVPALSAGVAGLVMFFAGWGILRLLGVTVIRPKD